MSDRTHQATGTARENPHIVVLGAGFGGLEFCRRMKGENVLITVIDRQNHHLFQPLLYQVATAGLSVPEIAKPIRSILARQENVSVILDEATGLDLKARTVALRDTGSIDYDYLVIAVGARTNYFGNDHWEAFAPGLKTLDDATRIRHNILLAFEEAERERESTRREELMRIVVVGGGPTGVELAGSFAELAKRVFARDFRNINARRAQIVLLEVSDRILGSFPRSLSRSAQRQLESLGVEVRLNQRIDAVRDGEVVIAGKPLRAENIVWGAGVRASPLCEAIACDKDRAGRLKVAPDLSIPGHPEAFAVGDLVNLVDRNGKAVPGVSPAAMQMGVHAAKVIRSQLRGRPERPAFAYFDKGSMATIGRSRAIATVGPLRMSGFPAWLAWLFVHLVFLIGFRNKIAVLLQWFYSYVRFRRGARIITGLDRLFKTGNPAARALTRTERRSIEADAAGDR